MKRQNPYPKKHNGGRNRSFLQSQGFTLIEIIGVLAILAILASIVTSGVLARIRQARRDAEEQTLSTLALSLKEAVQKEHQIPGPTNWVTFLENYIDLSPQEIATTSLGYNRVYLADPLMVLGPNGNATLPYVQDADGSVQPHHVRFLIISSTWRPLPQISQAQFDTLWSLPSGSIPENWPQEWKGHGEDLHIVRIDLEPLFFHIVFNNLDPDHTASFRISGGQKEMQVESGKQLDRWYIQETPLDLYFATGTLQAREYVHQDQSYYFQAGRWATTVSGKGPGKGGEFADLVNRVLQLPVPDSPRRFGATPRSVLNEFYTYMWYYTTWANTGFDTDGSLIPFLTPMYMALMDAQRRMALESFFLVRPQFGHHGHGGGMMGGMGGWR